MTTITRAIESLNADTLTRATVDLAPAPSTRPGTLGRKQIAWLMKHQPAFRDLSAIRESNNRDLRKAKRDATRNRRN